LSLIVAIYNFVFGHLQEEKLPYAFYISDQELVVQLGSYLEKKKGECIFILHLSN
jgi:hypothetical protein